MSRSTAMDSYDSFLLVFLCCSSLLQQGLCQHSAQQLTGFNGQLRLVNVPNGTHCEGRLEIFQSDSLHQGWFTGCNGNIGIEELQVICRQLSCPSNAPMLMDIANYGSPPSYMTVLKPSCTGSEHRISQCDESDSYVCNFVESDLIGVSCNHGTTVQLKVSSFVSIIVISLLASLPY